MHFSGKMYLHCCFPLSEDKFSEPNRFLYSMVNVSSVCRWLVQYFNSQCTKIKKKSFGTLLSKSVVFAFMERGNSYVRY